MPDSAYQYVASPHDQVADEEILTYYLMRRDRTAAPDRLTPRMEARRILNDLDTSRAMRHAHDTPNESESQ